MEHFQRRFRIYSLRLNNSRLSTEFKNVNLLNNNNFQDVFCFLKMILRL